MPRELSRCAWKVLRRGLSTAVGDAQAVPGAMLSILEAVPASQAAAGADGTRYSLEARN